MSDEEWSDDGGDGNMCGFDQFCGLDDVCGDDHLCGLEDHASLLKKQFSEDEIPMDRPSVTIPLSPNATPRYQKQFPLPDTHKAFIDSEVARLLAEGKIRRVVSPSGWNSPLFVVQDGDKTDEDGNPKLRLVFDYRYVNTQCLETHYPLPNLHSALNMAAQHRVFTALDLSSGFHQLRLSPESFAATSFTAGDQLYEWCVLPFGVACAPSAFHAYVHSLLSHIPGVTVYIDDVLVAGATTQEHDERLAAVMDVLSAAGLFLNPSKAQCCLGQVQYLGHLISHDSISPLPEYMHKLAAYTKPSTCRQIRRLMGAANWVADFLPNLRAVMRPFQELSGRKGRFVWNDEHETAWEAFQDLLTTWKPLCPVKDDGRLELAVDASELGWGAVLLQWDAAGTHRRLVGCTSGVWSSTERAWHVREQELKAVLRSLRKWRVFVIGRRVSVSTDHRSNLNVQLTPSNLNFFKVARWVEELQEFDLAWEFVPGSDNGLPDWISRLKDLADKAVAAGLSHA